MINNIYSLNSLIRIACEILKIRCPKIFYIKQTFDDYIIKDSNYENTNKEVTDIIRQIKEIKFDTQDYCIYVNISIFQNKKDAFIKALKTVRSIYQLRQIVRLKKEFEIEEDKELVDSWSYAYSIAQKEGLKSDSPLAIDRNAFAYVCVYILFHIDAPKTNEELFHQRYECLYNQYKDILLEIKKGLLMNED